MISKKILSAILSVCVVGGVGTVGAATLANTPHHLAVSPMVNSEITSSIASSSASSIVSSSTSSATSSRVSSKEVKNVDDGVSAIQKATDDGISEINNATSSAISAVKDATNGSSKGSTSQVKNVKSDGTIIKFQETKGYPSDISVSTCYVDEKNKYMLCTYGGHFWNDYNGSTIKSKGLVIKDKNGNDMNFTDGGDTSIKIPYTNLSDISTLYFCLAGQQIQITVTQ